MRILRGIIMQALDVRYSSRKSANCSKNMADDRDEKGEDIEKEEKQFF